MAKAYVCDACGATMANPYEANMREFYVGITYGYGMAHTRNVRTPKRKVHLCDDCYHALHEIAKGGDG